MNKKDILGVRVRVENKALDERFADEMSLSL